VVRGAPAGGPVELTLNGNPIEKGAADAAGDVKIPLNLSAHINKTQTEAQVTVDFCGDMRRVHVFERGQLLPPPAPGCERREITGLFFVRRVSSIVVNLAGANPTVLLIQGSYSLQPPGPGTLWATPRQGLVLFGGIGLSSFRDAFVIACGNVSPCSGDDSPLSYTAGASYWISPYIAAEGSYFRPEKMTFTGNGDGFRFTGTLDAEVFTIAGKIGIPFRSVRVYGKAGGTYHRATAGTSETIDEKTITVDGVQQTIPGGTQALELKTAGWGWLFGGGVEVWVFRSVGLYGEVSRLTLKGGERGGGEGKFDEGVTALMGGVRLRFW
jgi:hypothetical protein